MSNALHSIKGLLCSFDPTFASFALVTPDNRLKIFDVVSGSLRHQFVDSAHLSARYSCIAWGFATSKACVVRGLQLTFWQSKHRGKKSKQELPSLVALGTENGFITVWDLARGAVVHHLGTYEIV